MESVIAIHAKQLRVLLHVICVLSSLIDIVLSVAVAAAGGSLVSGF